MGEMLAKLISALSSIIYRLDKAQIVLPPPMLVEAPVKQQTSLR
jgi:hypothetical protein